MGEPGNRRRGTRAVSRLIARGLAWGLEAYKVGLSPLLPPSCRFAPTCSEYAGLALKRCGLGRGLVMTMGRLSRCHPFHPGGWDPPS